MMNTNSKKNPNLSEMKKIEFTKKSEEFNPFNPMTLYEDFDFDEEDEVINKDNYENSYGKSNREYQEYKKTNKFVYESFADRIKKVKVKLSSNFQNDVSFLQIENKKGFIKSNDSESNFLTILNREKVLNTSEEFRVLESELKQYTQSYLIFINNSDKILKIFSEKLKIKIEEKVKNFPFIISLMEILTGLIKDLRDETYDEFLDNIFPNLIKLISETQKVEVIEKTFAVLVNIFKFLQNAILKPRNFSNFFFLFSELIFSKIKYIRKFTCESISYLIKNLDENKLGEIILIILNPFINPEKYFDMAWREHNLNIERVPHNEENPANDFLDKRENKNFMNTFLDKISSFDVLMEVNNCNREKNTSKSIFFNNNQFFINFLHDSLLNFEYNFEKMLLEKDENNRFLNYTNDYNQKLKLKVFLIECLADFILEIIIGINKDISIKADLFLDKLKIHKSILGKNESSINHKMLVKSKEHIDYLNYLIDLSVITALVKLFNKLKYDKRHSVFSLLNFYLLKKFDKEIKFNKLKSEKIINQLENFEKIQFTKANKEQDACMNVDEANNRYPSNVQSQKLKYLKSNFFVLKNFFIFELFNKSHIKFDKEVKRYLFEFLEKSTQYADVDKNEKGKNIINNIFYPCDPINKNYFHKITKINLMSLLIKFYPQEFLEFFKLGTLTPNCCNRIKNKIDFNYLDIKEFLNILNMFNLTLNHSTKNEGDELIGKNKNIDEILLNLFLQNLKQLQNVKFFRSMSFFEQKNLTIKNFSQTSEKVKEPDISNENEDEVRFNVESINRNNPYLDNDDYNIDYNNDLINKIFSFILNFYDLWRIENILDIKSTYDLISIKNSKNEDKSKITYNNAAHSSDSTIINFVAAENFSNNYNYTNLLILNEQNLNLIIHFINKFSVDKFRNIILKENKNNIKIETYVEVYSFLIIGDLLVKSISYLKDFNLKNVGVADLLKDMELLNIFNNPHQIYLDYIIKSIESILAIFERNQEDSSNHKRKNFAIDVLKINKEYEIMLYNILFKDFNDIKTFYIDKIISFLNLLDLFTENYLRIVLLNSSFNNKNENDEFISRILMILFSNCENGVSFKTINNIISTYFRYDWSKFITFCKENRIFLLRKSSIIDEVKDIYSFSLENDNNFINSLEEFLYTYSPILYSSNNEIKSEFVTFTKFWLNSERNYNIKGAEEIFEIISYILNLEFDILNDKKYALNFEVLVSKMELITLDKSDKRPIFIFNFIYDFLIGSYWIRFTKTLWPILTKCIQRYFTVIENINEDKLYWMIYHKSIKIFEFIHDVGTIENMLENIEKTKFEKYFFIFYEKFDENIRTSYKSYSYLENIIISSFYAKRDNISSLALNINLFYDGFLKAEQNFEIIINSSVALLNEKKMNNESCFYLFDNFYNFFSRIINPKNENWLYDMYGNIASNNRVVTGFNTANSEFKYYMNYFNNFITEKESKKYFGSTNKNLQETILTIISKLNFSELYKVINNDLKNQKEDIKNILYDQIIFSRTHTIQKLCVLIYLNLEPKLKKFSLLFEKLIDTSNIIDRLYNLQDIRTDSNELIKSDERELLIPILIRLYYSKYFYIKTKTKKVKTRNKINIVSFFIQLSAEEFKEYIKVIFRPLMVFENLEVMKTLSTESKESFLKNKFENEIIFSEDPFKSYQFLNENLNCIDHNNLVESFETIKFLDLRIYRKILEIISLNFKQINSLFESSIDFLALFITNILIFIKKINNFFTCVINYKKSKNLTGKHEIEKEILFDNENGNKMDIENASTEQIEKGVKDFLDSFELTLKNNNSIADSKYISYWEKNNILDFSNLYFKFVKEIKKNSFDLLKRIFSKFSYKKDLIKLITDRLFYEYEDIYRYLPETLNLKANSLIQFTVDISKNPIMHKIFIDNSIVFNSLCRIISNKTIDNKFLNVMLEFMENIISPYSEYKSILEEAKLNQSYDYGLQSIQKFEKIDNRYGEKDEPQEDEDEDDANISRRRKLTTDSNLSFLQSDKDKNEKDENEQPRDALYNRISDMLGKNLLDKKTFEENEKYLIQHNFKLFNENIINLLTNGRLKLKIKEYATERTIYLLLELWNIFDIEDPFFIEYAENNQESINRLIKFLIDFITKDSKIFTVDYKIYLSNILRLCNILLKIITNKKDYYLDFLHLIYKISDTSSRLILSVVLKQIQSPYKFSNSDVMVIQSQNLFVENFQKIYDVLIKLNITKGKKSLEDGDNLDIDQALENLNIIDENFCSGLSILHLEPLVYQLITMANFSDDFSIRTLSISKIKIIFETLLRHLYIYTMFIEEKEFSLFYKIQSEAFANILRVFLNLLNLLNFNRISNQNRKKDKIYSGENYTSMNKTKQEIIKKNILDLFSFINSNIFSHENFTNKLDLIQENKNLKIDIYSIININLNIFDDDLPIYQNDYLTNYLSYLNLLLCRDLFFIKTEKGEYDFFEAIMNLKYEVRSSILVQLREFLIQNKIKYFSLLNIIIPVIKSFLNFETEKKIQAANNFDIFHRRNDINAIVDSSIDILEPICKILIKQDFVGLLMHFYRRINKMNSQDQSKNYDENKYAFEKLYEVLSRLLECLNYFKFDYICDFDFDTEFNSIMRQLIQEYKSKANLKIFISDNRDNTNDGSKGKEEATNVLNKLDHSKINKLTNDKFYSKDLFKESFNSLGNLFDHKIIAQKRENFNCFYSINPTLNSNNNKSSNKFLEFSANLTNQIFSMLKNMLIDNYRKDRTKKYYIRNFVIRPFFLILKKMDPRTLKYELISLVYEIMNNLKNKDLEVRDKARQAIRILIEILGPFILNVLLEQLKSQLSNGYQRYIMGYTCNYIFGILNKIYLNFKEIEEHTEAVAITKSFKENNLMDLECELENEENNQNTTIKLPSKINKIKEQIVNLDNTKKSEAQKEINNINHTNTNENLLYEMKNSADLIINNNQFDFEFISKYKKFSKKDIELVFDFSICLVVPILLDELFGEVSEEKEIEQLVKKYKEGKEIKAYSTFSIIASRMDFKSGILNLIFPIRNFVIEKEINNSLINKINEVMNSIVRGLKENITLKIDEIIIISYSLINIGLEINIKNSKEIKRNRKVTVKGGDLNDSVKIKNDYIAQKNELVALQLGTNSKQRYSIEISRKFILDKNDILISNLFTQFGLDLFFLAIKKNVFDFTSIKSKIEKDKNKINNDSLKPEEDKTVDNFDDNIDIDAKSSSSSESDNSEAYQKDLFNEFNLANNSNTMQAIRTIHRHKNYYLRNKVNYTEEEFNNIISHMEILVYSIICCLKISSNNILSKSLKILTKLFDTKLFVIKKNLKKIGSNLFKNLGIINPSDSDKTIAQTILSCISEILKKFTFFDVSDTQIKLLINFLKIYVNNLEIKSYIFSCLFAIIKRKFLHPSIYDMIEYIQETYLISFDEATKSLCECIIIEFLNNYPLNDIRKNKHINFFIINLESKTRNCVLNSLRMIKKLIDFANIEKQKGQPLDQISNKIINNDSNLLPQNQDNQVSLAVKNFIDFLILKLLYLIANSSDSDIKEISSKIIQEIFEHMINKEKYELYLSKIIEWIKIEEKIKFKLKKNREDISDDEADETENKHQNNLWDKNIYLDDKEKTYVKLGLNFLSILSFKEHDIITDKCSFLLDILINNLKFEFYKFQNELDTQIENRNYSKLSEDDYIKEKDFNRIFESKDSTVEEIIKGENKISTGLNLKEEDVTVLNIQLENWDIYYLHLIILEKFSNIYSNLFKKKILSDKKFLEVLFQSIKHPHIFIKTAILRFLSKIFCEDNDILNLNNLKEMNTFLANLVDSNPHNPAQDNEHNEVYLNTLQIIFDNLKFIILNKDINLKDSLVESAIDVSSYLAFVLLKIFNDNQFLKKKSIDYSYYPYEFICRLYGDSKKYLANKSYSNIIVKRILRVIENIIEHSRKSSALLPENKKMNIKNKNKESLSDKVKNNQPCKEIELLLEPVLSLLYRLSSNNLVDEELKSFAERLLENLKESTDENMFSNKYKDVRNEINLLRKKRKVEQMQTYLKDQKSYYKQKKK